MRKIISVIMGFFIISILSFSGNMVPNNITSITIDNQTNGNVKIYYSDTVSEGSYTVSLREDKRIGWFSHEKVTLSKNPYSSNIAINGNGEIITLSAPNNYLEDITLILPTNNIVKSLVVKALNGTTKIKCHSNLESIVLTSDNGDINFIQNNSLIESATLQTNNGDINYNGSIKNLRIKTNNGEITLNSNTLKSECFNGNGSIQLISDNGDINIKGK